MVSLDAVAGGSEMHLIVGVAGFSATLSLVLVDIVALKRFVTLIASQREQHNNPLKFALEIFGRVLP